MLWPSFVLLFSGFALTSFSGWKLTRRAAPQPVEGEFAAFPDPELVGPEWWVWGMLGAGGVMLVSGFAALQRARRSDAKVPPVQLLIQLLEALKGLLLRPENDYSWSSWTDAATAEFEVDSLLASLRNGTVPAMERLTLMFAPTGPAQEVSTSSGWAREFLALGDRFDQLALRLWPSSDSR